MSETVSIIVPVYRAEKTLERCVDSLAQGDYKNIEVILVEDCSPDNSWALCTSLQEKYSCVKAFRNERNSGPSATRNRALMAMTGTYVMFVDSDDWVEPDFISSFVTAYREFDPELVVCGYMNHDEVQNATTDYFGWENSGNVTSAGLKENLLSLYKGRLLQQIWNKCFRADIIQDNQIRFDTSIRMGEDFRFLLSYLSCCPVLDTLVRIDKPLYHYIRCSETSLMSQFGSESIEEPIRNLEKLYVLLEMDEDERNAQLQRDRRKQIELWAYLIMHNLGTRQRDKRRMILALDEKNGNRLYLRNLVLYMKEQILVAARRIRKL